MLAAGPRSRDLSPGEQPGRLPGKGDPVPVLRDAAPLPPSQAVSPAVPPEKGPVTVDRLRALWSRVIEDARVKSPMLGALLQQAEVAAVDGTTVTIRLLDTNPVHAEGIERQREAVAHLLGPYVLEPVRVKLEGAGRGAACALDRGRGACRASENAARQGSRPQRGRGRARFGVIGIACHLFRRGVTFGVWRIYPACSSWGSRCSSGCPRFSRSWRSRP